MECSSLHPSAAQLPHLANSFRQARAQTGLPPSPLFPPTHTSPAVPASPQSQLGLLRTQSAYHSSSPVQSPTSAATPRASTAALRTTTTVPATVRPSDEGENGEPPPPPYSRQDPEPEATAQLTRELSRLSTGPAVHASPSAPSRSREGEGNGDTSEARVERERRELEEAIRRSRESAEEEEALRLSRESAEAEEMTRLAREREQAERVSSSSSSAAAGPPPLPARSSGMDAPTSGGSLASPIQPIRTGSNNPFASALEEAHVRYAPPPGPPPGHTGVQATSSSFTPPPGPPPGHPTTTTNPFADSSAVAGMDAPDLAVLSRYDTVILVDDSGSMAGDRWRQVRVVSHLVTPSSSPKSC